MSKVTMEILKECAPVFSMLQDERRQEILMMLFDHGEMGVTSITERSAISRPAVSHHLKLLLDAGLIDVRQEGKERIYKINLQNSLKLLKSLVASIENDLAKQE